MSAKTAFVRDIYTQVHAPQWAAPNLDGLADVLRDLSWLPAGPVLIARPSLALLSPRERATVRRVLADAVAESQNTPHPLRIRAHG